MLAMKNVTTNERYKRAALLNYFDDKLEFLKTWKKHFDDKNQFIIKEEMQKAY